MIGPMTSLANVHSEERFGPWNPGIESTLPREFMPLTTVYNSENVSSTLREIEEINDFCGLALDQLSTFTPKRLALHEVLIRVMADLTVPDGEKYEDLGVNFRHMTAAIMNGHILAELPQVERTYDHVKQEASEFIAKISFDGAVARCGTAKSGAPSGRSWWRRFLAHERRAPTKAGGNSSSRSPGCDLDRISLWRSAAQSETEPLKRSCYQAWATVAEAVLSRHGRLPNDSKLMTSIALRLVCNDFGSTRLGDFLDSLFRHAVRKEGYRFLPAQSQPIVMNVKGPSASGKSTMRPLQKELAARLGVDWADFALISPDIWRKYLLDYASLGPARRYAGTLTGMEVGIIDQKLDRYMSHKGKLGQLSHLLIDRFRFDSFAQEPGEEEGSRLLTRFGTDVFMFFVVTPPEATVERAWSRGLQFGRYKAVDDLLAHNVEAYSGIPGLFFTWALRADKRVHFEFLDNSVAAGQRPRTIAFGLNGRMNVLNLSGMLNIDRFCDINIEARSPEAVYAVSGTGDRKNPLKFLRQCAQRLPMVNFAHQDTGQIYAQIINGRLAAWNRDIFAEAVHDDRARSAFELIAAPPQSGSFGCISGDVRLDPRQSQTLGQWANQPHRRELPVLHRTQG
jgi:hypothetical protein